LTTSERHYEDLLAKYYSWMLGDYEAKVRETRLFFETLALTPRQTGQAVDLGCGSGVQSVALAQLGYEVLSVDLSITLLKELEKRDQGLNIKSVCGDMLELGHYARPESMELVTCFGDTLTHLNTLDEVKRLIREVFETLEPGGMSIWTYRDYSKELVGTDRIIPVRSDETRIMTAFLEYKSEVVEVHDVIYERVGNEWVLHKSSYKKLRLDPKWVGDAFKKVGFVVERNDTESRMVHVIAHKPK
jgi:SAM-dependent methyltransferase